MSPRVIAYIPSKDKDFTLEMISARSAYKKGTNGKEVFGLGGGEIFLEEMETIGGYKIISENLGEDSIKRVQDEILPINQNGDQNEI